jgi:hypothetical protein
MSGVLSKMQKDADVLYSTLLCLNLFICSALHCLTKQQEAKAKML